MPLLGTTGTASAKAFNLYGIKSRVTVPLTISSNTYNYDVYTNRGPTYIAGASDIVVTVNPGVTVGSTSTGTYSLLVPSSFSPLDTVTIVNQGLIQGMGGNGGTAGYYNSNQIPFWPGKAGSGGGNAIYVNRPTTITNNGTVASGGGGGGGGAVGGAPKYVQYGGGGGGGGAGTNGGSGGASPAGGAGSSGSSPTGGGGGSSSGPTGGAGGSGGGRGAAGSGGGPGTAQGLPWPGGSGGAAGSYIVGNPFVTWPVTGTRQGNVS